MTKSKTMYISIHYIATAYTVMIFITSFAIPTEYVWLLSMALLPISVAVSSRSVMDMATKMLWLVQKEPPVTDVLMVFGLAKAALSGRKFKINAAGYPLILLALFAAINVIQISWSVDWARASFYAAVTVYTMFLLPFVFWQLERLFYEDGWRRALTLAIDLTAFALVIAGIAALLGLSDHFPWLYHTQNRARAFFKDVNVAGPFVIIGALRILSQLMIAGRYSAVSMARLAVYIAAIAFTFSRGAYLNLAVGIFLLGFIAIYKKRGWRFALFFMLFLVLGAAYLPKLITDFGQQRVVAINPYDTQGRFAAWRSGLMMALDHPLGVGPGQFEVVSPIYQRRFIGNATVTPSAHSMYVRIIAENGIIGGAALLSALAWILIGLISVLKIVRDAQKPCFYESAWLLAAIIGILAEGLVIDVIHWRHFGIVMGLAMYYSGVCGLANRTFSADAGGVQ